MASELGVDKKVVNGVLYGKLKGLVYQDKRYRWYPREYPQQQEPEGSGQYANTPLGMLARYYPNSIRVEAPSSNMMPMIEDYTLFVRSLEQFFRKFRFRTRVQAP